MYVCRFCQRSNFRSQGGLTQHQRHGVCGEALQNEERAEDGTAHANNSAVLRAAHGPTAGGVNEAVLPAATQAENPNNHMDTFLRTVGVMSRSQGDATSDSDLSAQPSDDEANFGGCGVDSDDEAVQNDATASNSDAEASNSDEMDDDNDAHTNTRIRDQFQAYLRRMDDEFMPLNEDEIRGIKLISHLYKKKVALNTYPEIMEWHLNQVGLLRDGEDLRDCSHYIGRQTLVNRLTKRYNFENKFPSQRKVKLPVSGEVVKITLYDLDGVMQQLLTHPEVQHADYFFFDGNPMAPPPEKPTTLSDFPTGRAYGDTYRCLDIKPDEGEQLVGLPLYMDGAAISHFHDQELIQVRIALGFYNRVTRTKEWAWAGVGNIERVSGGGHEGVEMVQQSNHMDVVVNQDADGDSSSGHESFFGVGEEPLQDTHAMLAVILEEVRDLCKTGFVWDLAYKGKVYKNIKYKVFIPFIKCDNQEADMICGKYLVRGWNIQQICRVCHVSVQDSNDHLIKAKKKTVREIKSLVEAEDLEGLKAISQSYIDNAFHELRFNLGNEQGVHGACPFDMLHTCQLGTFKRCRDVFFEFVGATGATARKINALAIHFGRLFARQSDRTLPNCTFSHGIQKGKLMGKEYRGVLLLLAAILVSSQGQQILGEAWRRKVRDKALIDDWILLLETLLEWEAYLCSPEMLISDVQRLSKKNRYLMYLIRRICKRREGMGLRTLKFHLILHLAEDILLYGVPLEVDTSSNESHHKPAKAAAMLTQRSAATLNIQTETRLTEMRLFKLALHEIESGRAVWNYYDGCSVVDAKTAWNKPHEDGTSSGDSDGNEEDSDANEEDGDQNEGVGPAFAGGNGPRTHTGENQIQLYLDQNERRKCKVLSRSRSRFQERTRWEQDLVTFLWELQDRVGEYLVPEVGLQVFTRHKRGETIFRGHPNFRGGGPWRDWAIIDWGRGYGQVPCHIWCFVVLDSLPAGYRTEFGGVTLSNGVYAVVESTTALEQDDRSTLFQPYEAESELDANGEIRRRVFYLADVDAIVGPCTVIPDIGGPVNRYFRVKPKSEWADEYLRWLRAPHIEDEMDPLDENDEVVVQHPAPAMADSEEEDENPRGRRRRME